MARQRVELPSKTFNSKMEAIEFFKEILNSYEDKQILNSFDAEILYELLQRHPEAQQKIGIGVEYFYRARSPIHPSSCFHIKRIDGTTTDFSYPKCISGKATTLAEQFYQACRNSVAEKLIHEKEKLFREAGGTLKCSKTNEPIFISEADYCHTSPSFQEIVRNFILEYDIKVTPDMLTHSQDMQYVVRFANPVIENLFKTYHTLKANLAMFKRLVS